MAAARRAVLKGFPAPSAIPANGHPDSGEVVFLCIASVRVNFRFWLALSEAARAVGGGLDGVSSAGLLADQAVVAADSGWLLSQQTKTSWRKAMCALTCRARSQASGVMVPPVTRAARLRTA